MKSPKAVKQVKPAGEVVAFAACLKVSGFEKEHNYRCEGGKWAVQIGGAAWAAVQNPVAIQELNAMREEREGKKKVALVKSVAGPVEVVTKQEMEFKRLAQEIVEGTVSLGGRYLALCDFIRANQVSPKDSTKWLLDLGFHKAKASEINRVAQAPDEVYSQLQARTLGWRGVLQLARGNVTEMKQAASVGGDPAMIETLTAIEAELEVVDKSQKEAEASGVVKSDEEKEADKAATLKEGMERAAKQILVRGLKLKSGNRKWRGEGYILELRRLTKKDMLVPVAGKNE